MNPRDVTLAQIKQAQGGARTDREAADRLGLSLMSYRCICDDYSWLTIAERGHAHERYLAQGKKVTPRPTPLTVEEVQAALQGHTSMLRAARAAHLSYTRLRYWAIEHGLYTPQPRKKSP